MNKKTLVDSCSLGCEIGCLVYSVPNVSGEHVHLIFKT